MADNTTVEASMTSLKTSVSEGKALIAAAVTDKGVETAASSSFSTIANNIANITMQNTVTYVDYTPSQKNDSTYTCKIKSGYELFVTCFPIVTKIYSGVSQLSHWGVSVESEKFISFSLSGDTLTTTGWAYYQNQQAYVEYCFPQSIRVYYIN